jgi:hypothetical protein
LKRFIVLSALLTLAACGGDSSTSGSSIGGTLQIEELVIGTGATAVAGDTVSVNYVTAGRSRSGWVWGQ